MNTPREPVQGPRRVRRLGARRDALLRPGARARPRDREHDREPAHAAVRAERAWGRARSSTPASRRPFASDPETRRVAVFNSWIDDRADELRAAVADSADGYVYVILDQFEEFFLYHDVDGPFGTELASLLGDRGLRVNVLLSLREDTLAALDAFKGRIANLLRELAAARPSRPRERAGGGRRPAARLRAGDRRARRGRAGARRGGAGRGRDRAARAGRRPGAAQPDGGARDAHIEAPFLQLVLERLWDAEREAGSDTLRLETLTALGGAEAIVREHLDRALAGARVGAEGRRREHLRPSRHALGDEDRAPRGRSRRVRVGRRVGARVGARDARARADPACGGWRERRRGALRDLPRRARRRGAGLAGRAAARARAPGGRAQAPAAARDRRRRRWSRSR